jgi:ketosteroid isomerase-like protein
MRTVTTLLVGAMLGSGITAAAALQVSPADAATKAAVTEVKRAIVEGHRLRDRASLDRLYADDYTAIDGKGVVRSKQDLLDALPSDPSMVEGRYDLIAVRRWGAIAVATGRGRMRYANADGSTRVSEYYSFNVFEQRDGRWMYAAAFLP